MPEQIARMFGVESTSVLLQQALTHPSFANEQGDTQDNQRLEFLGDSVLGMCVSELLWQRFPNADEGQLTRMRAQLVSTEALAEWGREHGIASALRLGRGAENSGLRESTSVVADTVEAVLAAVLLEGGIDLARGACAKIVEAQLQLLADGGLRDPKTQLQERVQGAGHPVPRYEMMDSWGPPHERWFKVRVAVAGNWMGEGIGRSKRTAERDAAQVALGALDVQAVLDQQAAPMLQAGPEVDGLKVEPNDRGESDA